MLFLPPGFICWSRPNEIRLNSVEAQLSFWCHGWFRDGSPPVPRGGLRVARGFSAGIAGSGGFHPRHPKAGSLPFGDGLDQLFMVLGMVYYSGFTWVHHGSPDNLAYFKRFYTQTYAMNCDTGWFKDTVQKSETPPAPGGEKEPIEQRKKKCLQSLAKLGQSCCMELQFWNILEPPMVLKWLQLPSLEFSTAAGSLWLGSEKLQESSWMFVTSSPRILAATTGCQDGSSLHWCRLCRILKWCQPKRDIDRLRNCFQSEPPNLMICDPMHHIAPLEVHTRYKNTSQTASLHK